MTYVDIRPRGDRVVPECPRPAAQDHPARRGMRTLRWLAAWAVFSPGGGLAYQLLTHPED